MTARGKSSWLIKAKSEMGVGMDGWIPNGVRNQGKYPHLNCLYAGFTFTYLIKHNTGFRCSDFLKWLREISRTFVYRCGSNIKIRPLHLHEFPCDKGSYKNQTRNSCTFLPEVAFLSKHQCLKECQIVSTTTEIKNKSQPFRLARQWLRWSTKETLGSPTWTQLWATILLYLLVGIDCVTIVKCFTVFYSWWRSPKDKNNGALTNSVAGEHLGRLNS